MPTCSEYGFEAIARHGLWAGGWLTLFRVMRCGPGGTHGIDNVPATSAALQMVDAVAVLGPWKAPPGLPAMTVPMEYRTATKDFEAFLADVKQQAMVATHNQAYAMTRAVLHVFRDRLTVGEGLEFAQALPPVLRAIFVEGWQPPGSPRPFPDRDQLTREVLSVREAHNTAPASAIGDVAAALRRHADPDALRTALSHAGSGRDYWLT